VSDTTTNHADKMGTRNTAPVKGAMVTRSTSKATTVVATTKPSYFLRACAIDRADSAVARFCFFPGVPVSTMSGK
jgi:hypothetical protein